jgi:hypothetical protein
MPGKSFSNISLLVCVCLWLWGVFLVDKRLLDLDFWSNLTIWVFWLQSWVHLHLGLWLRGVFWSLCFHCFFPQIEYCVDCSLLLALFSFRFCWFSELILFVVFLPLVGLTVFLVFYSFLGSHICDCFIFFHMYYSFK